MNMEEEKKFTQLLPSFVERWMKSLWVGHEDLDYGRDIVIQMTREFLKINDQSQQKIKILDVGAGQGTDLINVRNAFTDIVELNAIESYLPNVESLNAEGVNVVGIDIERDALPFHDGSIDLIIANQVVEHTKEVFFIFSEFSRVLKEDGVLIIGIPNLAALHNRILLLMGEQPTCIRMPGPHIRGITKGAFKQFVTTDGYFTVERFLGSSFFPFPPFIARILSSIFPSLSITLFFVCKRTGKSGTFIEVLDTRLYETNYFRG